MCRRATVAGRHDRGCRRQRRYGRQAEIEQRSAKCIHVLGVGWIGACYQRDEESSNFLLKMLGYMCLVERHAERIECRIEGFVFDRMCDSLSFVIRCDMRVDRPAGEKVCSAPFDLSFASFIAQHLQEVFEGFCIARELASLVRTVF